MPLCHKCGKEVPSEAAFCPSCGANLKIAEPSLHILENKNIPSLKDKICPLCGMSVDVKKEELKMSGKYGVTGRGYDFYVYICQRCGYSQFFFKGISLTT